MVAGSTANQAVKILNELGEYSNPSTEEKQDSQIALQETLQDLSNGIYDLIQLLAFLPSVRGTLADLRVTQTSTARTISSGTVTTLSNQTSIGGFIATPQIPTMMNLSGQNNINNVTIT